MILLLDWEYDPYVEYITHSTLTLLALGATREMHKIVSNNSIKIRYYAWKLGKTGIETRTRENRAYSLYTRLLVETR